MVSRVSEVWYEEYMSRVQRVLSVGVTEGSSLTGKCCLWLCVFSMVVRAVVVDVNLGVAYVHWPALYSINCKIFIMVIILSFGIHKSRQGLWCE